MNQYLLHTSSQDITIEVISSRRKTFGLEIKDGAVKARVPFRMPEREIKKLIEQHQLWIIKKLQQTADREQASLAIVPLHEMSETELADMRHKFFERVSYYANLMGVTYGRITIRDQKTRWGSCSSKGNLNFNYQLYFLPEELLDYVVVHELAHRKQMNHSPAFWQEVEYYYPNYKNCRGQLKRVGIRGTCN